MSHPGGHEQPVKSLYLSQSDLAILPAAAEERKHTLVVVDAVLRCNQLVVPAVILEQLAAALPKLPEIWIGGVENRSELGFSFEESLVSRWILESERPPIPGRIGEHQPFIVRDWNSEGVRWVAVGPERL